MLGDPGFRHSEILQIGHEAYPFVAALVTAPISPFLWQAQDLPPVFPGAGEIPRNPVVVPVSGELALQDHHESRGPLVPFAPHYQLLFSCKEPLHAWHILKQIQNQGRIRPQKIKGSSNA